jgi:hypothetical protein
VINVKGIPLSYIVKAGLGLVMARALLFLPTRVWVEILGCEVVPYFSKNGQDLEGGEDGRTALRIRALQAVARRVPWRANCLPQAMAFLIIFKDQLERCRVVLGTSRRRPINEPVRIMRAHAWVEQGGKVVLGDESRDDFVPVACIRVMRRRHGE